MIQETAEYRKELARTVWGVGIIGSVLSVYVVGHISKREGKPELVSRHTQ